MTTSNFQGSGDDSASKPADSPVVFLAFLVTVFTGHPLLAPGSLSGSGLASTRFLAEGVANLLRSSAALSCGESSPSSLLDLGVARLLVDRFAGLLRVDFGASYSIASSSCSITAWSSLCPFVSGGGKLATPLGSIIDVSGATAATGSIVSIGSMGAIGATGAMGAMGAMGATGATGAGGAGPGIGS